jgi:hypothetical protein
LRTPDVGAHISPILRRCYELAERFAPDEDGVVLFDVDAVRDIDDEAVESFDIAKPLRPVFDFQEFNFVFDEAFDEIELVVRPRREAAPCGRSCQR